MTGNSYETFFTKARKAKAKDALPAKDQVRFSVREKSEARLRQNMKVKRPKPPVPWKAVAGLVVSLFLAVFYLLSPETFEALSQRVEISAFGPASAAETPAEKSKTVPAEKEKAAASKDAVDTAKGPDDKSQASEELSHYEKLKQRKEELDSREKELAELEEELQRQKVELDKRITQLEDMRNQIAQTLKDRVDVDQDKVNKLVDLYSNMKPKQAADILGALNEELAVEVLAKMKKKSAAEIMNLLPPEKARVLSEKYTGYRRISSTEPKG